MRYMWPIMAGLVIAASIPAQDKKPSLDGTWAVTAIRRNQKNGHEVRDQGREANDLVG